MSGLKTAHDAALLEMMANPTTAGIPIKGKTDGIAIAAGYVGESIITVAGAGSFGTTTLADTWTDASAMGTLTLTAGVWMVGFDVLLFATPTTGTQIVYGSVRLYNTTDAAMVPSSISFMANHGTSVAYSNTVSKSVPLNITGTKTIRIETRCNLAAAAGQVSITGSTYSGALTDPDNHSILRAYRIA